MATTTTQQTRKPTVTQHPDGQLEKAANEDRPNREPARGEPQMTETHGVQDVGGKGGAPTEHKTNHPTPTTTSEWTATALSVQTTKHPQTTCRHKPQTTATPPDDIDKHSAPTRKVNRVE